MMADNDHDRALAHKVHREAAVLAAKEIVLLSAAFDDLMRAVRETNFRSIYGDTSLQLPEASESCSWLKAALQEAIDKKRAEIVQQYKYAKARGVLWDV